MEEQVLFAGFGGQGVLSMAKFLAAAAMHEGKHVAWVPSYGAEMRGGTANCLVTISTEEIASPVTDFPTMGVILNGPSMEKFSPKVQPGGTLVVNTSLVTTPSPRTDLNIVEIPVVQLADQLGNALSGNMILVGACLAYSGLVGLDRAIDAIDEVFYSKKAEAVAANKEAFLCGVDYIETNYCSRPAAVARA
jgi:2-oxoglutarate ferredoxin oxidoreductase subunit gamma